MGLLPKAEADPSTHHDEDFDIVEEISKVDGEGSVEKRPRIENSKSPRRVNSQQVQDYHQIEVSAKKGGNQDSVTKHLAFDSPAFRKGITTPSTRQYTLRSSPYRLRSTFKVLD